MRTKEDIKKQQEEMRARTQQMKKELKLEKKELRVLEEKSRVSERKYEIEEHKEKFQSVLALSDMVANSSANNFTQFNIDKVDKGVKENLIENDFFIEWNRALYIASYTGYSGLVSYIGKDKRAKILAGELSDIVIEDKELIKCTISIGTFNPLFTTTTMLKWEKEDGVVYLTKWTNNQLFSDSEQEKERQATPLEIIPVSIMLNNSTAESDIHYTKPLMQRYGQVIEKMEDDIDYGGNKLAVAENILKAFGGKSEEENIAKLLAKFRKAVFTTPVAHTQSLNNNIPTYEISSQPFYNDELRGYLETIRGEIYKFSGLHEGKGKVGAQETDSQVQNNNKQQNDSIETKKIIREITLKNVVLNHSIVMQQSSDKGKLYKNINEIDVEIELSSNQIQQLNNGEGDEKDGKPNVPGFVRPNSK